VPQKAVLCCSLIIKLYAVCCLEQLRLASVQLPTHVCIYMYVIQQYIINIVRFHQILKANHLPDFQKEQMNRFMPTIKNY